MPAGDAQAMADALVRLASEPARAAELGRAGRIDAEQKFSMQAMVAAYRHRYDAALHALPSPGIAQKT